MVEIKKLTIDEFKDLASKLPFNEMLLTKDYHLTLVLYLLKGIEGIYFKGGTALQKIFLNYPRLSEDIDLTLTKDVKEVIKEIKRVLEKNGFKRITKDKDVEGFTRLVIRYKGFSDEEGVVFIDLNKRAKILMNPEKHKINHFYKGKIPEFSFNTLAKEEMIAEKVAAAIGRNQPRDHYDLYRIIKERIPINLGLVKKKCTNTNIEFNLIKMFNKAKTLKNRWDEDLTPLLAEQVSFQEVIRILADYFNLKEEKKKRNRKPIVRGF